MNKKKSYFSLLTCLVLLVANTTAFANTPPLYIATDKASYLPGEKVRFEGILTEVTANYGATAFVELLDCKGNLHVKKMLPVNTGICWGSITLPETNEPGFYLLYCYTMLNDRVAAEGSKKIWLQQPGTPQKGRIKLQLSYAFEGGSFIAQAPSTLLIRCTDEHGNGTAATGKIINTSYSDFTAFETDAMGYATIVFTAEPKLQYQILAVSTTLDSVQQPLLLAASNGINLGVSAAGSRLAYTVYSLSPNETPPAYTLTILAQEQPLYNADIKFEPTLSVIKESLPSTDFPEGWLTFRLTDNNNKLYAQRIIYNSRDTGQLHFIKIVDTINQRIAETEIPNYINGRGYVNVILDTNAGNHPYTSTALVSETSMPVLKNGNDTKINMNDLLITCKALPPAVNGTIINEHPFLTLSGRAYDNENKPLKYRKLNILLQYKNLKKQFCMTSTDKQGDFKIKNLLFYDSAMVYYQLGDQPENKTAIRLDCKLSPATILSGRELPTLNFICAGANTGHPQAVYNSTPSDNPKKDSKTLTEVIVQSAKTKTDSEVYAAKNISDQHNQSNFVRNEFDFIAHPQVIDNMTIFQFLRGRMASLIIDISSKGDIKISTNYGSGIGVYLNDMEMDASDLSSLANVTVNDVALVRYYSVALKPRVTSTKTKYGSFFGGGGGGDLMIYTKNGFTPQDTKVKSFNKTAVYGYQVELPVRTAPVTAMRPQSLFWNPEYQPGSDLIIYTGLPAGNARAMVQVIIEGVNTNNAPYSFTKNLVFK